jgi:S-adenosylmethionine synthetase
LSLQVSLSALPDPSGQPFEVVERKGIGHPDTICDALAEGLSLALSRFYVERFGRVLHHNVDKVLLCGGSSQARFGGGEVTAPIEIFFAGRATQHYRGVDVPVAAMARQVSDEFFRRNFRLLDPDRHVRVHCLTRPGSEDLVELFARRPGGQTPLANDSSIGVGFAPLTAVERGVLAVDPAFGEDLKLLAVRRGSDLELTVACAMCDRYVPDLAAYVQRKAELAAIAARAAGSAAGMTVAASVNAADDPTAGSIYLTVTGTSAEAGDDGEAGRGNRASGLITPGRPMSMEGVAGKNPVSHVGKLYSLAAVRIAEDIVAHLEGAEAAECLLVSRIGAPVTEPQLAQARIRLRDGRSLEQTRPRVEQIVRERLQRLAEPQRWLEQGVIAAF